MKKNQYCVLNKHHTKDEYEKLVPRIIGHMKETGEWGEFFPIQISPFGYNETVAQVYFPLTKEQAYERGYPWQETLPHTTGKETMSISDILDSAADVTKEIFACTTCARNYKIIAPELKFYQSMRLPLPRHCPQCRYERRMKERGMSHVLYPHQCACTGKKSTHGAYTNTAHHNHGDTPCLNTFETTFGRDCLEIVYCDECYRSEVI